MQTPTNEPTAIVAGDTAKWLKSLSDYPASAGWLLTYTLINATVKYTVVATASGDDYLVTIPSATSELWSPGEYAYAGKLTLGVEGYTAVQGNITVKPSFNVAATLDTRSQARKALDAIDARLIGVATDGVMEYQIAGRQLKNYTVPELLQLQSALRRDVAREVAAQNLANGSPNGGLGGGRRTFVRFGA